MFLFSLWAKKGWMLLFGKWFFDSIFLGLPKLLPPSLSSDDSKDVQEWNSGTQKKARRQVQQSKPRVRTEIGIVADYSFCYLDAGPRVLSAKFPLREGVPAQAGIVLKQSHGSVDATSCGNVAGWNKSAVCEWDRWESLASTSKIERFSSQWRSWRRSG